MELVYKNENTLLGMMLALAALCWTVFVLAAPLAVQLWCLALLAAYCFAKSALAAWLRGTGVKIDCHQFPDLQARIARCSERLGVQHVPPAYLVQGGNLHAIASRFLASRYILLNADVVDALEEQPDAINFYIGHEIGHIRRRHMHWALLLLAASLIPLLGAAYSRAREYTCDRHGFHACDDLHSAQTGLAALAAGGKRWRQLSVASYAAQAEETAGFWMSFHELVSDDPWLVKRMAAVRSLAEGRTAQAPARNALAFLPALLVPRLGRAGGFAGLLLVVSATGMLAAGMSPEARQNRELQRLAGAVEVGKDATAAVERYFYINGRHPDNLAQAGFALDDPGRAVVDVRVDGGSGVVRVYPSEFAYRSKPIAFVPVLGMDQKLSWLCGSAQIPARLLPAECRAN